MTVSVSLSHFSSEYIIDSIVLTPEKVKHKSTGYPFLIGSGTFANQAYCRGDKLLSVNFAVIISVPNVPVIRLVSATPNRATWDNLYHQRVSGPLLGVDLITKVERVLRDDDSYLCYAFFPGTRE